MGQLYCVACKHKGIKQMRFFIVQRGPCRFIFKNTFNTVNDHVYKKILNDSENFIKKYIVKIALKELNKWHKTLIEFINMYGETHENV